MNNQPRRTVNQLGEAERDAIWRCNEPIWRAFYAWHPEDGWLYCNGGNQWPASRAGHDTVTAHTIAPLGDIHSSTLTFTEVARFGAEATWLWPEEFGPPLVIPESIEREWSDR